MLVGRGAELAALEGALARARGRRGGLVLVAGEPGAGKTSLVGAAADRAQAVGAAVGWGICPAVGATPYLPWRRALRRTVPAAAQRLEHLSGGGGAAGCRRSALPGPQPAGPGDGSTTCEVVESVPGRMFAFVVGSAAKPSATWRYELEPVADGTRVTESFVLPRAPGWFARLSTRLLLGVRDRRRDLVDGMEQTLERLGAAAEQARSSI